MPDPSRSRRPPRLDFPPVSGATGRDRAEFARALDGPVPDLRPSPPPPAAPSAADLLRELRRGVRRIREESEISLRQQSRAEARRRLETFLRARQAAGDRFVKVIHGKGHRSRDGLAILPKRVPEWLLGWKPELVAGFGPARRDDGGTGALYVVLSPRRPAADPARRTPKRSRRPGASPPTPASRTAE